MFTKIIYGAAAAALMISGASAQSCKDADIDLKNGVVYTVDEKNPSAEAIAILGSKIIYVGDDIGVERYACGEANVIDLMGKAVYPGLIDAYGHLSGVGSREVNLNLQGIDSLAETIDAVKAYADANPDLPWITGRGWIEKIWPENQRRFFGNSSNRNKGEEEDPSPAHARLGIGSRCSGFVGRRGAKCGFGDKSRCFFLLRQRSATGKEPPKPQFEVKNVRLSLQPLCSVIRGNYG